jgi:hypothetical protein
MSARVYFAAQSFSGEVSVASPGNQNAGDRGSTWLALLRTLIVQIVVLLALAAAVSLYLDWSSDANWAEFIAASQTSGLVPRHPPPKTPVQAANGQAPCRRGD